MIIVDANYFLGIYDELDSLHQRCLKISESMGETPILYLEDVLKETQTVLSIRKGHAEGFEWIDSIYDNESPLDRQYTLGPGEYFQVLNTWRALDGGRLSFVDAEIIYLARKHNFPVLSFDNELLRHLPKALVVA